MLTMPLFSEAVSHGPEFFSLAPWIVLFPAIGLLINMMIGGRLPEKVVGTIASTASGLAFVVSVLLAYSVVNNPEGAVVPVAQWIHIGDLNVNWSFQIDSLSTVMMLVVSGVGTLIHIYSIGYMHEDVRHNGDPKRFRRFFVFLNLFIAMMMILVGSDNYLMLFVGWEGVGLCSFLLIGFWYEKGKDGIGNALAAKKAFVVNRIGDFGFLLAAMTMFWAFGSFNFHEVFEKAPEVNTATPWIILAITLFLLIGVTGKSAQIPLYVWLPDAMAGPTPVSALIHAATMVTAGVYLITRSNVLYSLNPTAQLVTTLVGATTAIFAATIAAGQFDIKKVLAYSTVSQLGFMVAAVGMGAYTAGMFHLVTHAFFKGLLFLASGSVIQGVERGEHHVDHDPHLKKAHKHSGHDFDPQDMRNMGGMRTQMKTTFWVYLIGAAALSGVVILAGFWSKDEILTAALNSQLPENMRVLIFTLLTITAFLTAFYMTRQVILIFFGKSRSLAAEHAVESPAVMTIPLIILAVLSLVGGILNLPKWSFLGPAQEILGHSLEHTIETGFLPEFNFTIAGVSITLALLGILGGIYLYGRRYPQMLQLPAAQRHEDPLQNLIGPIFKALKNKWWVDELYWLVIVNPYIAISRFLADVIDWRFWHDWFHDVVLFKGFNLLTRLISVRIDLGIIDATANGLGRLAQWSGAKMRNLQTGYVRNYALAVFLGMVIILSYLVLR
jgi:NADH-quinone oxidoreductase subunit L